MEVSEEEGKGREGREGGGRAARLLALDTPPRSTGDVSPEYFANATSEENDVLLLPSDYERRAVPPPTADAGDGATVVELGYIVEDILEVDDRTFSMAIELKLSMRWRDPRLRLTPSAANVSGGSVHLEIPSAARAMIWTPNFSIGHLISFAKLETLQPTEVLVVDPIDGERDFWLVHQGVYVIRMKCPMDFNQFPFDDHFCYFEVSA